MTKDQVVSWTRQIASVKSIVDAMGESIDQLKGNLIAVSAMDNSKQEAAIKTDLDRITRDREKLVAELLHRVNTTDLAGVDTRLTDLQIRLEIVSNLFDQWRRRLAHYELMVNTNSLVEEGEEGVTRKQINDMIDKAKEEYEASLQAAVALIPNKAVVIA